jgi:hypothetical protein
MRDYGDFDDSDPYQQQLDTEWIRVVVIRELLSLASREMDPPSYERIISICKSNFPDLFNRDQTILFSRKREDPDILEYQQKAVALSRTEEKNISPFEVLEREIKQHEDLLGANPEADRIQIELDRRYQIRFKLKKEGYTEQQALLREVFKVDRNLPISGDGKDYREFELPHDRVLRLRLFHPDTPEHSTGTDLVYEHYSDQEKLVRIAALQFKIWNGRTFSLSGKKLERFNDQLTKLHCTFCEGKLCKIFDESEHESKYRLPYCTAFLRPTDRLQDPNTRLATKGYYIPISVFKGLWNCGKKGHFTLKEIKNQAIPYNIFEELFNSGMLGSRWLTYTELEQLYKTHKVLDIGDRLIIHAQVYDRRLPRKSRRKH